MKQFWLRQSEARQKELRAVVAATARQLKTAPEGTLHITGTKKKPKFYWRQPGERGVGQYLNRSKEGVARRLIQKKYDEMVLDVATQELNAWKMLASFFPKMTFEEVYETLSPLRQKYVAPVVPTAEEFRRQWEAVEYEPGWFKPGTPEFWTDRGERVRSKSEQLIANLLFRLGIPYRYEFPIEIVVDGRPKIWRPDFMVLDVAHRKEFFLEHFGMLDSDEYASIALRKMAVYEQNGLYEGQGMYYTFETKGAPLDVRYVESKVLRILADEGGGIIQKSR